MFKMLHQYYCISNLGTKTKTKPKSIITIVVVAYEYNVRSYFAVHLKGKWGEHEIIVNMKKKKMQTEKQIYKTDIENLILPCVCT